MIFLLAVSAAWNLGAAALIFFIERDRRRRGAALAKITETVRASRARRNKKR